MTSFDILNDILMKSKFEIDIERDDEVKPDMWLKVNPFNHEPVQVADIRPYTHEEKEEKPLIEFKMPEPHGKLVESINREFDKCLKNKRLSQHADLMDAVMYAKFAMDKVEEDEMIKNCGNCKHSRQPICEACYEYVRWEAKEEKMNVRLELVQKNIEGFLKTKCLSYDIEYRSFENELKVKVWNNGIVKRYTIFGDGCNPSSVVANMKRDIIKDFKLNSIRIDMHGDLPAIKNVIFNDPATIVFWTDGTKTVVKAQDEAYDPEKGMAMAIAKKALGNQGNYCNVFKKWLPEEEEIEVKESTFIGTVTEHNIGPDGGVTLKGQIDGINANIIVKGIIE